MRRVRSASLLADRATPTRTAHTGRNLLADASRAAAWQRPRGRLWRLLEPLVPSGGRVAVVGAGNGHDVPLERLAARAGETVLIDIDGRAVRAARRRQPRELRRRIRAVEHDVTGGAADAIVTAALRGRVPPPPAVAEGPLPGAPYDVVVGDLLYSQLLYPALLDLRVPERRRRPILERHGRVLVCGLVSRLHASAPGAPVVHLHDPLGWWGGHEQPIPLPAILALAGRDVDAALGLARHCRGPGESDPRAALAHFGIAIEATELWRWPFTHGTDYLVCATVARASTSSAGASRRPRGAGPQTSSISSASSAGKNDLMRSVSGRLSSVSRGSLNSSS